MEIWFECTTSGQRCAAEVGEGCSAADLQERAVAVLYPQSVVSAEAVGLCVDGADGEVLAPEVLIAHTALCAGGTVYVSRRKQDSSGVWVPQRYTVRSRSRFAEVCEGTLVLGGLDAVSINLVTTKVTPLLHIEALAHDYLGKVLKVVLMPHHMVYCSLQSNAVYFRLRDSGAEVVVRMACRVVRLVAMRVTETVLIGTNGHIVQYSCEGVKMRTIDHSEYSLGYPFAVSPCETLLLSNGYPTVGVYRLDTPELSVVHRVDTGQCHSSYLRPLFSPDSSLVVLRCGSNKRTVRTFDIVSGQALCTLPDAANPFHAACFSACSRYLFTATTWSVWQWDARSGAPMGRIDADNPRSVHASTDGSRLVVLEEGAISVLDIAAFNMQVSEEDALQHGPPAEESRCSRCVCS